MQPPNSSINPPSPAQREKGLRDLDLLVAEQVMGWTWRTFWGPEEMRGLFPPPNGDLGYHPDVPEYSSDIAAAFQVVEKMRSLGWVLEFTNQDSAHAMFWQEYHRADGVGCRGDSVSHAICRTALKALGVEISNV